MNGSIQLGIEEGYERWALTYDRTINPLLALEERHVTPLLTTLRKKAALDLACGTGRWLQKLVGRGTIRGVGVDFSAAMLRVAATKPDLRGRLVRADCLRLPFCESVFDFAISSFALSHIAPLKDAIFELARLLKPNSDVFVTDLHAEAYARGWRTNFRDRRRIVEIEASPHTAEGIGEAFRAAGFRCLANTPLYFGEAERPLFERAGKSGFFDTACQIPAILFCHFRR